MKSDTLQAIEKQLPLLSVDEQQLLFDHLAEKLHKPRANGALQAALTAMANDPQIQAENRQIESEFSTTEGDGLEAM